MCKIDSYASDKYTSNHASEDDKKNDISKLEKLLKRLELLGFSEMAIK